MVSHLLNADWSSVPPEAPSPGGVQRSRIMHLVDRGVRNRLTLVSAPAGTGKTAALAQWIHGGRAPGSVLWIPVDSTTNLERLTVRFRDGLSRAQIVDEHDLPDLRTAGAAAVLSAIGDATASRPIPVVVVLDCASELPQDATAGLHELVSGGKNALRVIVAARADPLLPLHLYRMNDEMTEIRSGDLAFTRTETRELLLRQGWLLPADVADEIFERTQGWVTGLMLASQTLAEARDVRVGIRQINGASGRFAEYLRTEVLNTQLPAMREFMLHTSVVDFLRPGLIEALVGPHGARSLAYLARGNAFLEELPASAGYRYHPLFRELLTAFLAADEPSESDRLHLIATQWFVGKQMIEDAVRTAVEANEWDEASSALVDDLAFGQLLPTYRSESLRKIFKPLPANAQGTASLMVGAILAMARGDYAEGSERIEAARVQLGASPWPAGAVTVAVLAALCAASMAASADTVVDAAAQVHRLLDKDDSAVRHPELILLAEDAAADALFREGRFAEAAHACNVAVAVPAPGFETEQANCVGRLAVIAAWSGHCRQAIRLAHRARALGADAGLPRGALALPEVALALAYAETGDFARASECSSLARRAAHQSTAELPAALADVTDAIIRSRIRRVRRDLVGAREATRGCAVTDSAAPAWATDQVLVEEATVDLLEGRLTRALTIPDDLAPPVRDNARLLRAEARVLDGEVLDLDGMEQPLRSSANLGVKIQAWLLEALSGAKEGDERRCIEALDRALRLSAPEHLSRPFREVPEPVRTVLSNQPDLLARHRWLFGEAGGKTRRAPRTGQRRGAERSAATNGELSVELTEKEREVLGLLAQLFTTEETAATMFISVNTVRTHVRNILRKLSVSGRYQAIRRARDLGVLPND